MMVVGAAIAAAFAVTGCAPQGYDGGDYGNAAEPAAENVAATAGPEADPAATSDPAAQADPNATEGPGDPNAAPELSDDEATNSLTGSKVARMGKVVVNDEGFVLYRFDNDGNNPAKSNCAGDCAETWPPALTNDGKPKLKGVDSKLVGTVTRADGSKQLTLKGWPLYTYIGDKKPGNWKGQNVNGTWFVIQPDGAKNLTCLPKISKPVAPPANDSAGDGAGSSDDSGTGSDYSY
ncbi:putative lipoprotein with Yx(FWY)xxD motif [Actinoplanes abujensis]|uniref:Putative lipoprotein with Yx(FWY)xxD motif n=2 Tax=Paractinoplanes abujensis TaxID=882441 RepID=A0A7W7D2E3_9ACTN|nr:putative lipoprotein with Yx(FWY)xxD motif [Actinoplanes abujensis]